MTPYCPVQGFLFHAYSLWTSADAWIAASRRKPVLIIRQSRTADGFASPLYVQNEMTTANGRPKLQRHSLVLAVQYHSRVLRLVITGYFESSPSRAWIFGGRSFPFTSLYTSHAVSQSANLAIQVGAAAWAVEWVYP